MLGIGETEYARRPLELASRDIQNAEAARTMLSLLKKMEADVLRRLAEDEKPAVQENAALSVPRKGTQGINESGVIWAPTGGDAGAAIGAKEPPPANKEDNDGDPTTPNSAVRSPGK